VDVTALQVDDPLMEAAHGQEQPVTPPCSEFGDLDLNELDDFDAPLREAAAQGQDDFGDDIPDRLGETEALLETEMSRLLRAELAELLTA